MLKVLLIIAIIILLFGLFLAFATACSFTQKKKYDELSDELFQKWLDEKEADKTSDLSDLEKQVVEEVMEYHNNKLKNSNI